MPASADWRAQAEARRERLTSLPVSESIALFAYAAGVIDSDGSIGIRRETHAMRAGRATQPTFSERVTIRQLEPEAVDLVHTLFGGCRSVINGKTKRQKLQSVQLVDRQACSLLAATLPYLRIKRHQAELCLEMRVLKEESRRARFAVGRGHRGGGKRPELLSAAMERVHSAVVCLNRVEGRGAARNSDAGPSGSRATTDSAPELRAKDGGPPTVVGTASSPKLPSSETDQVETDQIGTNAAY